MWVYVCVYAHTHTLYTDGVLGCEPRSRDETLGLEGPKNPDGVNPGTHTFVNVYKVHMCMYMLEGGMRSYCFFREHHSIFSSEKEKQKM